MSEIKEALQNSQQWEEELSIVEPEITAIDQIYKRDIYSKTVVVPLLKELAEELLEHMPANPVAFTFLLLRERLGDPNNHAEIGFDRVNYRNLSLTLDTESASFIREIPSFNYLLSRFQDLEQKCTVYEDIIKTIITEETRQKDNNLKHFENNLVSDNNLKNTTIQNWKMLKQTSIGNNIDIQNSFNIYRDQKNQIIPNTWTLDPDIKVEDLDKEIKLTLSKDSLGRRNAISAPCKIETIDSIEVKTDQSREYIKILTAFSKCPLLRELSTNNLRLLMEKAEYKVFSSGETIRINGELYTEMLIITSGTCKKYISNSIPVQVGNKPSTQVVKQYSYIGELRTGDVIGEECVFYNSVSQFFIVADKDVQAYAITSSDVDVVTIQASKRKQEFLYSRLKTNPILRSLRTDDIMQLIDSSRTLTISPGFMIVLQAKTMPAFFIIEAGVALEYRSLSKETPLGSNLEKYCILEDIDNVQIPSTKLSITTEVLNYNEVFSDVKTVDDEENSNTVISDSSDSKFPVNESILNSVTSEVSESSVLETRVRTNSELLHKIQDNYGWCWTLEPWDMTESFSSLNLPDPPLKDISSGPNENDIIFKTLVRGDIINLAEFVQNRNSFSYIWAQTAVRLSVITDEVFKSLAISDKVL